MSPFNMMKFFSDDLEESSKAAKNDPRYAEVDAKIQAQITTETEITEQMKAAQAELKALENEAQDAGFKGQRPVQDNGNDEAINSPAMQTYIASLRDFLASNAEGIFIPNPNEYEVVVSIDDILPRTERIIRFATSRDLNSGESSRDAHLSIKAPDGSIYDFWFNARASTLGGEAGDWIELVDIGKDGMAWRSEGHHVYWSISPVGIQGLSVSQAAAQANVDVSFIRAEIERGNLIAYKVGKQWAIDPQHFKFWLTNPRRGSRSK